MITKAIYLRWVFLLVLIAELSFIVIPNIGGFVNYRLPNILNPVFGFANFDGLHYLGIAKDGYKALYVEAFFPGYPLLVRTISFFTLDYFFAGWIVSLLCFYVSLKLIYELSEEIFDKKAAYWTQVSMLLFPTAFFYGAIYTESLFLLLGLLTFKYSRKRQWSKASIAAGLACTVKFNGIFLVLSVLMYFVLDHLKRKDFRKIFSGWPIPFSLIGLVGYMWYLFLRFDDPLYFVHVQSFFNPQRDVSRFILLHQVFFRYLKMIIYVDHTSLLFMTVLLELIMAIMFIYLMLKGIKVIDLPMTIYSLVVFLLPTLTGTFSSLPRYVLIIFPSFLVWGYLLSRWPRIVRNSLLILSVFGLIVYQMMFIRGYFVG